VSAPEDPDADLPSLKLVTERGPTGRQVAKLFGAKRTHPRARELASEVHDLLMRYATEVVGQFALCPFLHNVEVGMGKVGIILDAEPSVEVALAAIVDLDEPVLHLVFPLAQMSAAKFEPFGSKLAEAVRRTLPEPLVHATFHPDLTGGRENAHRLVGLLRQSPDPFVQFVPPGLAQGGTVLAGEAVPEHSHADARFERLMKGPIEALVDRIAALKRERETRYAELASLVAGSA